MRLNVQHLNVRSLDTLDSWVEKQILELGRARQIDEANVRLIRRLDATPAYEVNVQLLTPGPDFFAASRDHTLRAAFSKAVAQLRQQAARRADKRLQRLPGGLSARGRT